MQAYNLLLRPARVYRPLTRKVQTCGRTDIHLVAHALYCRLQVTSELLEEKDPHVLPAQNPAVDLDRPRIIEQIEHPDFNLQVGLEPFIHVKVEAATQPVVRQQIV